ncbi:hypothetical protein [uncultured Aquimarina sp.]|uniref:hypothetical protein n=1 Tax=uncultured Aquimarina sp. TaxID=575652 RepID=UPI002611442C|nr:hypothetical protein [uncultured Aquimarina sp.]
MLQNILNLKGVEILKKNQLETINGGTVTCSCNDISGTWSGNYSSISEIQADVNKYCSSGAHCSGTLSPRQLA